jgi:hypothetical protein
VYPWQELQIPVYRNTFFHVVVYGREISPCSALPSTVLAFGITGSNLIVGIGVWVCFFFNSFIVPPSSLLQTISTLNVIS